VEKLEATDQPIRKMAHWCPVTMTPSERRRHHQSIGSALFWPAPPDLDPAAPLHGRIISLSAGVLLLAASIWLKVQGYGEFWMARLADHIAVNRRLQPLFACYLSYDHRIERSILAACPEPGQACWSLTRAPAMALAGMWRMRSAYSFVEHAGMLSKTGRLAKSALVSSRPRRTDCSAPTPATCPDHCGLRAAWSLPAQRPTRRSSALSIVKHRPAAVSLDRLTMLQSAERQ